MYGCYRENLNVNHLWELKSKKSVTKFTVLHAMSFPGNYYCHDIGLFSLWLYVENILHVIVFSLLNISQYHVVRPPMNFYIMQQSLLSTQHFVKFLSAWKKKHSWAWKKNISLLSLIRATAVKMGSFLHGTMFFLSWPCCYFSASSNCSSFPVLGCISSSAGNRKIKILFNTNHQQFFNLLITELWIGAHQSL